MTNSRVSIDMSSPYAFNCYCMGTAPFCGSNSCTAGFTKTKDTCESSCWTGNKACCCQQQGQCSFRGNLTSSGSCACLDGWYGASCEFPGTCVQLDCGASADDCPMDTTYVGSDAAPAYVAGVMTGACPVGQKRPVCCGRLPVT